MKRSPRLPLALAAVLLSSGCFRTTYQTGLPPGGVTKTVNARYLWWGLAGSKDVYLDELCPKGPHEFGVKAGFGDVMLTFVTLGIYTPRTIYVECAPE
jgi:hypothetical protein